MLKKFYIFVVCCCFGFNAFAAAQTFPSLTGRVVDTAHILSANTAKELEGHLTAFEQKTGHQLVVVTLDSLQGYPIEDYGYQLGRHWGIGRKGKDDGVLLIVALKDRLMRIEVGYGLEGELTDALSSRIIQGVMVPAFKAGDMQGAILHGAQAIISTLGGEPYAIPAVQAQGQGDEIPAWVVIFFIIFIIFVRIRFGVLLIPVGGYGSGWSSSRGAGGGFSGGGGGFGGGGSSGRW